jgi:ComF family protein
MTWRIPTGAAVDGIGRRCRGLLQAVMPRLCVFCGSECTPAEPLCCTGCADDLPWLGPHCPRCAEPLNAEPVPAAGCAACQLDPPPFESVSAVFRYAFPVDAALKALKFHRRLDYAPAFGAVLAAVVATLPGDIDALLPVPLHWRRKLWRGYNQSCELCSPIAAASGLPLLHGVCRVRPTPYQTGLSAGSRRRSLKNAFEVRGRIDGGHILIVDDVVTTGATCRQLAVALLEAGAGRVSVLAVARAGHAGLNE